MGMISIAWNRIILCSLMWSSWSPILSKHYMIAKSNAMLCAIAGSAPYRAAPVAAPTAAPAAAQAAALAADAAVKLPSTFTMGSSPYAVKNDWAQMRFDSSNEARRGGAGEDGQHTSRGGDASVLKALRAAATGQRRSAAALSKQPVQVCEPSPLRPWAVLECHASHDSLRMIVPE